MEGRAIDMLVLSKGNSSTDEYVDKFLQHDSQFFLQGQQVQWGSEYRPFEYQKHLNTELFEVQISNGLVFKCYVLCTRPTIQIPNQYIRKQDGIHLSSIQMVGLSSIQMAFKNQTVNDFCQNSNFSENRLIRLFIWTPWLFNLIESQAWWIQMVRY